MVSYVGILSIELSNLQTVMKKVIPHHRNRKIKQEKDRPDLRRRVLILCVKPKTPHQIASELGITEKKAWSVLRWLVCIRKCTHDSKNNTYVWCHESPTVPIVQAPPVHKVPLWRTLLKALIAFFGGAPLGRSGN
jgi:hypothetical protein